MNSFSVPVVIVLVFLRFSDSPAFSLFSFSFLVVFPCLLSLRLILWCRPHIANYIWFSLLFLFLCCLRIPPFSLYIHCTCWISRRTGCTLVEQLFSLQTTLIRHIPSLLRLLDYSMISTSIPCTTMLKGNMTFCPKRGKYMLPFIVWVELVSVRCNSYFCRRVKL